MNFDKGVIIQVTPHPEINYESMAEINAAMIYKHWGLPTIIELKKPSDGQSRSMCLNGTSKSIKWNNFGRWSACFDSPFKESIIVDADYLVQSNRMNKLSGLFCFDKARSLSGQAISPTFGTWQDRMYWATVVGFTPSSEALFRVWRDVEQNWDFYTKLYCLDDRCFRNDWALCIAANAFAGLHYFGDVIPWDMTMVTQEFKFEDYDWKTGIWTFLYSDRGKNKTIQVMNQDLHFMDKGWLTNALFDDLRLSL